RPDGRGGNPVKLLAAGIVADAHGDPRFWAVSDERRVSWWELGGEAARAAIPVPGEVNVVAIDPFAPALAVVADGTAYVYRARPGNPPVWRSQGNVIKGGRTMMSTK